MCLNVKQLQGGSGEHNKATLLEHDNWTRLLH